MKRPVGAASVIFLAEGTGIPFELTALLFSRQHVAKIRIIAASNNE
jgi:hypothetical protein